jgi:hypothetical protein
LDAIAHYGRKTVGELRPQYHVASLQVAQQQRNYFSRSIIQIDRLD